MFDLYGNERLTAWKRFRDRLEDSQTPFDDSVSLWCRAPFVNPYLDPYKPEDWPDPWHLILDDRLDNLAISLGMLYTLKLTQRFIDTKCEIHMSMFPSEKEPSYIVVVDDQYVLDHQKRSSYRVSQETIKNHSNIWTVTRLK